MRFEKKATRQAELPGGKKKGTKGLRILQGGKKQNLKSAVEPKEKTKVYYRQRLNEAIDIELPDGGICCIAPVDTADEFGPVMVYVSFVGTDTDTEPFFIELNELLDSAAKRFSWWNITLHTKIREFLSTQREEIT